MHLHHQALDRWLLPGRPHRTEDISLLDAALRELQEETGPTWLDEPVSPHLRDKLANVTT